MGRLILRTRWLTVGVALAVAAAGGLLAAIRDEGPETKPGLAKKPNIVMIMTDDQWLESMRVMSHTRRLLGDGGVIFRNSYVSFPLCCPSRATYLTGQYAHNNGVLHNAPPLGGYAKLKDENTLPVWLQKAGYVTSHIGKYPNGYGRDDPRDVPRGWTEWRGSVDPSTYRMWGYTLNENGSLRTYGRPGVEDPRTYQTDVYRDKAVDFIERRSGEDRPFFLSTAFLAPHAEIRPVLRKARRGVERAPRPAPRHDGSLDDEPLPRRFGEDRIGDKPRFVRAYPRPGEKATARIRDSYRGRLNSLLAVDEAVERIVGALKRTGTLDNTYLIFTSDNGFFFGEHRISTGKYLPYEASSHVPLLIRGPGLPAGRTSEELVSNVDLAATIADAAGVHPGLPVDGRSLLPFARYPDRRTNRPVLHEAGHGALRSILGRRDGKRRSGKRGGPDGDAAGKAAARGDLNQDVTAPRGGKPSRSAEVDSAAYEAIRTQRYLYIRYRNGARELYDYKVDPDESRSRHDDRDYAKVRRFLDRQLDRLQACRATACDRPIPDPPNLSP
ncbi:MAG: sulfatase-like hydrolase/transferase [Streptosporangiales bacterium]|nr:sulfatase-like hydrolase/transferase [Streptosporangiales bacterium]